MTLLNGGEKEQKIIAPDATDTQDNGTSSGNIRSP
jgi:hypothetical protein